MKENETFILQTAVEATVDGERARVVLPVGTTVTIVMVFGDPVLPSAYEVEAFLSESNTYALATVEAGDMQ
jgi:hypothetical protein